MIDKLVTSAWRELERQSESADLWVDAGREGVDGHLGMDALVRVIVGALREPDAQIGLAIADRLRTFDREFDDVHFEATEAWHEAIDAILTEKEP